MTGFNVFTATREELQARVAELENAQQENTAGVAGMAESYETAISMQRSRIVALPSINPTMFNADVVFGYRKAQREAIAFCAEAGIKLEIKP